ncbi:MAG: hypothetical protein FWD23_18470, partial [Oscillospiraceae bacterium]|nr:hypothetical protein [Oscillospiraceae bacterium]
MNQFKENYKTALDRIEPNESLNNKILNKPQKSKTYPKYLKKISIIAAISVFIFSAAVSAVYIYNSTGGFEKFFGTDSGYDIYTPTVISSSSSGDDVIFNYTGSWCDGVNLYISGTVITPEPLKQDGIYSITSIIKLQGSEKDDWGYSKLYITGENTAEFLFPFANFRDEIGGSGSVKGESIIIDIQINWVYHQETDEQGDIISTGEFYPPPEYGGKWLTTLSVPINSEDDYIIINETHIIDLSGEYNFFVGEDYRPLFDYDNEVYFEYTPLIINSVKLNPFTLIVEGEGFEYIKTQQGVNGHSWTGLYMCYIKTEGGLTEFHSDGNNAASFRLADNKMTVTFYRPLDLSKVISLAVVSDDFGFG